MYVYADVGVGVDRWVGERGREKRQGTLPDLEAGFSRKLKRLIVHCGAHHNRQLQALLMEVNM
jgi:hypothetical protein